MTQRLEREIERAGRARQPSQTAARPEMATLPPALVLEPVSRRPVKLPESTVQTVMAAPMPRAPFRAADAAEPAAKRVTIVIVSHNGLVFTKLCLLSLFANTPRDYPDFDVVVVDNGSTDGTPEFLRLRARQEPRLRIILNADNRGFARANNQGLAAATGDLLVLLNNDTLLPRGWLTPLVRHLEDPAIGIVGPLTNRAGNEAQIEAPYVAYGEFERFAEHLLSGQQPSVADVRTATMFCAALRREVYQEIGPLDERFEIGMFEDDDYAMRIRAAGYRVVCAEDAFVHHFGEASLGYLAANGSYGALFEANRRRFEEKWGVPWSSHEGRRTPAYEQLCEQVRRIVDDVVPAGATVAVVSRGDDALLDLGNRRSWHFPQTADGRFAGYHPADSTEAIALLETMSARGADYLVIPSTAFWWLRHYDDFDRHLRRNGQVLAHQQDTCLIVNLHPAGR